jgi:putative ABC transport system permease protein
MPEWKPEILSRLAPLKLSPTREGEIAEEISEHLEDRYQELLALGFTDDEARRTAMEELKGEDLLARGLRPFESDLYREPVALGKGNRNFFSGIIQDIRYALRLLRKTPLITGIAVISLALGIGANTAIFSLIDAVMLRMLPVQNPEQLAQIKFHRTKSNRTSESVTNPIWEQVRDHQDAFSGVFAWGLGSNNFDLADGGEENEVGGLYVSGNYFAVLGVRPAEGRLIAASDDVRGCSGAAVLSYGFWQSQYGGTPSAIGSLIRLNGHWLPIIGVTQEGFTGTEVGERLDVSLPICAEAILDGKNSMLDDRSSWWIKMMGRLRPGMSVKQANARMKVLSPELFGAVVPQDWPANYQDEFRKYTFSISPGATGSGGFLGSLREQYSRPLEILMFVVGLVLLIACANIASLLLARSAARQKEIAVRLSLGASRRRLIRQVLTESIVLASVGAILGIFFARWGSALLVRFVSTQQSQVFLDLKMDGRILAFTIGVTFLCGVLFGILPAFRSTGGDAISAMKEGQPAGRRSQSASARWIVATQIALSLILLVGTGLFIHTFANLMTFNAGFDRNNVLMVDTNIHNATIAEPARAALYSQMLAKLQAIPGVVSASQCWMEPLSGREWNEDVRVRGYQAPHGVEPLVYLNWVTPAYFSTMRTALLEGRVFDVRDSTTSARVAVVNQLFVKTYFPGQYPVGKHISFHGEEMFRGQPLEIVGVVQNAKYDSLDQEFLATAYIPLAQAGSVGEETAFEVRTAVSPEALIPAVRDAMASVNKSASLQFTTLKRQADDSVLQEHLMAVLSGFFGGLALLLTAIGVYGVMAYVVTQRTHEIGVRMALGAERHSILRLVMRDAAIVLATGIAVGLLGSVWVTRLVQQLLFGVKPTDPWSLALAIAALVSVALVASYIPARRAMHVDPMVALRDE